MTVGETALTRFVVGYHAVSFVVCIAALLLRVVASLPVELLVSASLMIATGSLVLASVSKSWDALEGHDDDDGSGGDGSGGGGGVGGVQGLGGGGGGGSGAGSGAGSGGGAGGGPKAAKRTSVEQAIFWVAERVTAAVAGAAATLVALQDRLERDDPSMPLLVLLALAMLPHARAALSAAWADVQPDKSGSKTSTV